MARKEALTLDRAQGLALGALGFLAEDGTRLGRFLALTGIGPAELREAADAPETLLAVLDYVMSDESLLLVFTASRGFPPDLVAPARALIAKDAGQAYVE